MDICLSPARAAASRRNGAKSKGPKTPEGKARSAQNALKHGLRAQKCVVLPGERASAFDALEAALLEELAPEGALETVLAQRVVAASWRLARAERLEAELFAREMHGAFGDRGLGLALIRDGNGARAFDTLLRYRGGTLAELFRTLRTLKALQAERAARSEPVVAPAPRLLSGPEEVPIEPEARRAAGQIPPTLPATAAAAAIPAPKAARPGPIQIAADERAGEQPRATPIEPESVRNPGDSDRPTDRANLSGSEPPAPGRLPPQLPVPAEPASCARP